MAEEDMIYMVECAFTDPGREVAWNDYYSKEKLDKVLAVPGFRTSQRFKAVEAIPAPYIAIHTVDSLEVLKGSAYKQDGGGTFDASFQPAISNWRRSLYEGLDRAQPVEMNSLLAVCDDPEMVKGAGINFAWLNAAGLDTTVPRRGIASVSRQLLERFGHHHRVRLYLPITPQRIERPDKAQTAG
jgi:hypothetical protein